MLKICTVYHKGLYTPDYVGKFYRAIKRNSSINFQRVCISDDPNVEADFVLPLNPHSNIKYHWHKLKFFSPQFAHQMRGDDIIIMDIDQVITGNIDELLKYPVEKGKLLTYEAWWDRILKKNGGFYKFKSGTLNHIWDKFSLNPEFWQLNYYNLVLYIKNIMVNKIMFLTKLKINIQLKRYQVSGYLNIQTIEKKI